MFLFPKDADIFELAARASTGRAFQVLDSLSTGVGIPGPLVSNAGRSSPSLYFYDYGPVIGFCGQEYSKIIPLRD